MCESTTSDDLEARSLVSCVSHALTGAHDASGFSVGDLKRLSVGEQSRHQTGEEVS